MTSATSVCPTSHLLALHAAAHVLTVPPDDETAKTEFTQLARDLEEAGLQTEVRAGQGHSLLIFTRANKEILNSEIHKSR